MDEYSKKLKMLLDQEMDMEGIRADSSLINHTLQRILDEKENHGTAREGIVKRRFARWLIGRFAAAAAAGLLLLTAHLLVRGTGTKERAETDNMKNSQLSAGQPVEDEFAADDALAGDTAEGLGPDAGITVEDSALYVGEEGSSEAAAADADDGTGMDIAADGAPESSFGDAAADGGIGSGALEPAVEEDMSGGVVLYDPFAEVLLQGHDTLTPKSSGSFYESGRVEEFPYSWSTETGTEAIEFQMEFQSLKVFYYCTADGLGGQYEVIIDGTVAAVLDADAAGTENYAASMDVYVSDETKEHTVAIKKRIGSTRDLFTLLGFKIL